MLRYLKWIFLVFGGLAFLILLFFYIQNKNDVQRLVSFWDKLDYDYISENCPQARKQYYYPCYKENFKKFLSDVGITGVSFGMNSTLGFLEEDRDKQELYQGHEVSIVYALNSIELNNMAIDAVDNKFTGFDTFYAGYLASVREYLNKAKGFTDGFIAGLEGEEGIIKLSREEKREKYREELLRLKAEFSEIYNDTQARNEKKIEEILAKSEEKK